MYRSLAHDPQSRPVCALAQECGACSYINGDMRTGLRFKHQEGIRKLEGSIDFAGVAVLPPVPSPHDLEYRCHAKIAVRRSNVLGKRFDMGMFRPGTHDVVDIRSCPLHHRSIRRCLRDLGRLLEHSPLTPYDEPTLRGDVRYLALRASHVTDELMLTWVVTNPVDAELREISAKLRQLGHQVRAVYSNMNGQSGNNIFGPTTRLILGVDRLRERLGSVRLDLGPTSFFQMNPYQAEVIAQRILALAGGGSDRSGEGAVAWDLYCGIGGWGLSLAQQGYSVRAVEESPSAVADARANADRNVLNDRFDVVAGLVEERLAQPPFSSGARPQVIVVNPSRRGLASGVVQALLDLRSKVVRERQQRLAGQAGSGTLLLYLSCDGSTFGRDIALLQQGGIRLNQVETFDMFPATEHLEWLGVLQL